MYSDRKTYIDAGSNANLIAEYLELKGYHYGYPSSGPCQRRAGYNMPFITIHEKEKLYSGSKGASTDHDWRKIHVDDLAQMRKTLIEADLLQPETDQEIHDKFVSMFGAKGLKKAFDGFGYGTEYTELRQFSGRKREIVMKRMREAIRNDLNLANHRKVMSKDNKRVERVWVTADGREMPISRMDDDHLNNTILFIDRKMVEGVWRLDKNEDLAEILQEMEEERVRRKMPLPLFTIKSLAYRKKQND